MRNKVFDYYPAGRRRLFEKIINSYLTPTFIWELVIDYQRFEGVSISRFQRRLFRLIWFWPTLSDAVSWREGGVGKHRNPEHFTKVDEKGEVLMQEVLERVADRNASILDLGCNCGRFLDFLVKRGYTNLCGVDISQEALDYMKIAFPETKDKVKLSRATFQEFLQNTESLAYEAVFSHGATVELVPATFPLAKHLCRVTRKYIILVISENGHSYPRFWEVEFERYGFMLTKLLRPALPGDSTSLMVFRRNEVT